MSRKSFVVHVSLCLATLVLLGTTAPVYGDETAQREHFEKSIRPLLIKHCFECHSHDAKRLEGNLYVDSPAGLLSGGDSGASIVPGDPEKSLLIDAVRYGDYEMPPKGKLPEADIELLVAWVKNGAYWPDEPPPSARKGEVKFDWKQRKDEHWSWQPVKRPAIPASQNATWPKGEVDHFILSRLDEANIPPAPEAEPHVWIRRVYFDLIGLPPTAAQVEAFLQDSRPGARERVVDELLQSPRFGEKWARHWMDLVRYSETYGHEFDFSIPHAWKYRDYLIRAFNQDLPYDDLVREHIAGDLLNSANLAAPGRKDEAIIGTGFWMLGEALHSPTHARADLSIRVENQIDVFSRAFLGLSVACARCHDHKFDAISKEDYHALYGIINSSHRNLADVDFTGQYERALEQSSKLATHIATFQHNLPSQIQATEKLIPAYVTAAFEVFEQITSVNGTATSENTPKSVQDEVVQKIASSRELAPMILDRWVVALQDPAAAEPTHPLYTATRLLGVTPQRFPVVRKELADSLTAMKRDADHSRQQAVSFASFDDAEWKNWRKSGVAFEELAGLGPLSFDLRKSPFEFIPNGIATSGAVSPKFKGAMRSPLFTLEHPYLHYRIRSKGTTVRLVIENYFMDHYQALLFRDMTRKDINTEGKWKWVTHGGDLKNHLKGRAFLEILDTGDGFFEIDEIHFSNSSAPPKDRPSTLAVHLATQPKVTSPSDVANASGKQIVSALHSLADTSGNYEETVLLNWMLQYKLVELPAELVSALEETRSRLNSLPPPTEVLSLVDGPGLDEPIHIRGSDDNFGPLVPRRFLSALGGEDHPAITHGSGRLELAQQVTSSENPLFSRVYVNRLWHHLFGRGIVPSVDDFGVMGESPTHPELLDWLASEFQEQGYSTKKMLRTIVLSSTYGMSSSPQSSVIEELDPANLLWHRMPVRRLNAEALRDAILSASGRIDMKMYGESVPVHLTEFMEGRGRPGRQGTLDGAGRRSIYQEIRRNFLSPMMLAFDMPSPFSCMGRRAVSNVPAQSLILMNDPFVVEQARTWAARAIDESPDNPDARIDSLFMTAFSHPANPAQRDDVKEFLNQQAALYKSNESDPRVWSDLCHMLLNSKEFLFVR